MKAGIIAAGLGERLKRRGNFTPKPLIEIAGEPLIKRAIRAAAYVGAERVACIVNELEKEVSNYLRSQNWPVPLDLVVKTTPNSMESLFNLAPFLQDEPFVLLTVDAVFPFDALKEFVNKAKILDGDGSLAITQYIDDEKPLWVKVDPDSNRIIGVGDEFRFSPYITAGFYFFKPVIFELIPMARKRNLGALRHFLSYLIKEGFVIYGVQVQEVIDLDYPEDIKKAEDFLKRSAYECVGNI